MLVDDNETFVSVLGRALTKRGYIPHIAYNEARTIELAKSHAPAFAVIDLKLTETSGLALIPQLIALKQDMNIVMLTGYASISTAVEAIKLGAKNYLCKPTDIEAIITAFKGTDGDSAAPITETPLSLNRLEWEHLQKVLNEHNGNISATARALGMHRRTLQRKLQKRPAKQ